MYFLRMVGKHYKSRRRVATCVEYIILIFLLPPPQRVDQHGFIQYLIQFQKFLFGVILFSHKSTSSITLNIRFLVNAETYMIGE
jgi:hypothetical protein